jgi:hypothetical protein
MKNLIILASLLASTSVLATKTYEAKTTSCVELQEALAAEKTIKVKYKWFGGNTYHQDASSCSWRDGKTANVSYVSASDKNFCKLGYTCIRLGSDR